MPYDTREATGEVGYLAKLWDWFNLFLGVHDCPQIYEPQGVAIKIVPEQRLVEARMELDHKSRPKVADVTILLRDG